MYAVGRFFLLRHQHPAVLSYTLSKPKPGPARYGLPAGIGTSA